MSPKSWIRRGGAAIAVSAALVMAVQPAALAAPRWWTVDYAPQSARADYGRYSTRGATAEASTDTATAAQGDIAAKIFELTNAERAKAGLAPLRRHDCLDQAAQNWSNRMSSEGRMYHSDLGTWMRGCSLGSAGENVAYGGRSAEETVRMWMNSPGHRANILSPKYSHLGVGWAAGGAYATQMFGS